jgi:thymidylate kinase
MRLVIIEGHDGTGKSTLKDLIAADYEARGFSQTSLDFPSAYPTPEVLAVPSQAMLFYLNDFQRTLASLEVIPDVIIADRSFLSTMVYQGFEDSPENLKECHFHAIKTLGSQIFEDHLGDMEVEILILNCDVNIAMRRMTSREAPKKDALEKMSVTQRAQKIKRLQERYMVVAGSFKYQWCRTQDSHGAFDTCRVFQIDTTHITPEQALKRYLNMSLEPEYFDTKI